MTRKFLGSAVIVSLLLLPVQAADVSSFPKAEYYRPVGAKTEKTGGNVQLDSPTRVLRFVAKAGNQSVLEVPYGDIQKIHYERSAKPRYAAAVLVSILFIFSKSKRHWLTIEYNQGGETKTAVIRLDKSNFTAVLKAVEAETGVKVEYAAEID